MARLQKKKLRVDAVAGVDAWQWHMRTAAADVAAWLAEIDAGNESPFAETAVPETELPEIEGDFDFAVVQGDTAGNLSDPASFAGWQSVSLDISPPAPATGGVIEDAG